MRTGRWLLAAACMAGCQSEDVPASLGPPTGTFVLRTVNGAPLPALGNGSAMTDFQIVADTLRIYANGEGVEVMVKTRPGVTAAERESARFRFTPSPSGGLSLAYVCGDEGALADCIAGPHHIGRFTTTGITFETSVMYRTPMVYQRIDGGNQ